MTWEEIKEAARKRGFQFIYCHGPEGTKWYELDDTNPDWPLKGHMVKFEFCGEAGTDMEGFFRDKDQSPSATLRCWEFSRTTGEPA